MHKPGKVSWQGDKEGNGEKGNLFFQVLAETGPGTLRLRQIKAITPFMNFFKNLGRGECQEKIGEEEKLFRRGLAETGAGSLRFRQVIDLQWRSLSTGMTNNLGRGKG